MINYVKEGSSDFVLDKCGATLFPLEHLINRSSRNPKVPLHVGDKLYYLTGFTCFCFTLIEINYDHKKPFYMWDKRVVSPFSMEYKLCCPKSTAFLCDTNFVPVEDKFEYKVVKRETIKRGRKGRV